jgi:SAM-dependent methyltransferase
MNNLRTRTLDIGCGPNPKNPYGADEVYGIDIRSTSNSNIHTADLNVEPIPFEDSFFDYVSAFDFIEHVPRILYIPERKFPFVLLMNEIYRVLKSGGIFHSFTPAFPHAPAWRDPTHVNIITDETFPIYFCEPLNLASMYGFTGSFKLQEQSWQGVHLITTLIKT